MLGLNIYDTFLIIIISFFNILVYYIIYEWILKLEKIGCKCSIDWRRYYIKYYTIFIIAYIFFTILYLFITDKHLQLIIGVNLIILIAEIIYIIVSIQYINRLKKEKCDCSDGYTREIIYIYSIILGTIYILSFLIGLYVFITLYLRNKINSSEDIKEIYNSIDS